MLSHRTAGLLATAVAALVLMPAQTALANDGTVTPTSCPSDYGYEQISNQGKTIAGVGPTQANYNGTGAPATSTFSAQVSGTVSFTYSSSVSVSASVVVADVSATVGISVSTSLTATLGNSTTVTAQPGQTAYAQYGVWRLKTTGYYVIDHANCTTSSYFTTAYSPWYVGWNTWTS